MREFTIGKNDAGQRLDRWLAKSVPLLPAPLAQKYIRLKRVKCNGRGAKRDTRLEQGDLLQLYINDEFFDAPNESNAYLTIAHPKLDILYEDEHLLLVNKSAGQVVHADESGSPNTLINHILAYLFQKGAYRPREENAFVPALCNRIDRNTSGIVIAAKTAEALRVMNQKIRDREMEKRYLCVAVGHLQPESGTLRCILLRDEKRKQVSVYHKAVPGGRSAVTLYRTLAQRDGLSLIECELVTGRTHQIRASLADAGCPLLGDGKYGNERINRLYHRRQQALCSWSLTFRFTTDAGALNHLNGKSWQVPCVDFVQEYFPDAALPPVPGGEVAD